jgi:hypothetical protein
VTRHNIMTAAGSKKMRFRDTTSTGTRFASFSSYLVLFCGPATKNENLEDFLKLQ